LLEDLLKRTEEMIMHWSCFVLFFRGSSSLLQTRHTECSWCTDQLEWIWLWSLQLVWDPMQSKKQACLYTVSSFLLPKLFA
jgi:hypothetical protein